MHGHTPHDVDLTHQGGKIPDLADFHAHHAHLGTRNVGKLAGDGHLTDTEALLENLKLGIAVFDEPNFLENRLVSQIRELQMMFPGGEFQGEKAMPVGGSPFVAAGFQNDSPRQRIPGLPVDQAPLQGGVPVSPLIQGITDDQELQLLDISFPLTFRNGKDHHGIALKTLPGDAPPLENGIEHLHQGSAVKVTVYGNGIDPLGLVEEPHLFMAAQGVKQGGKGTSAETPGNPDITDILCPGDLRKENQ